MSVVSEAEIRLARLVRRWLLTLEQQHEIAHHAEDERLGRTYGNETCHVCAGIDDIWKALITVEKLHRREVEQVIAQLSGPTAERGTFSHELWDSQTGNLITYWASPDLREPLEFIRREIEGLNRAEAEDAVKTWALLRRFGTGSLETVAEGVWTCSS